MRNIFVLSDFVRLGLSVVGISMLLTACGQAPQCEALPNQCTTEAVYGALCKTQPWYTLNGLDSEAEKYNTRCANLLGGVK